MATPREQHNARGRARVVGSGHLDGREPLTEDRAAAAERASHPSDGHGEGAEHADGAVDPRRSDALQRGLDAAAGEPRTGDAGAGDEGDLHRAPADGPRSSNGAGSALEE